MLQPLIVMVGANVNLANCIWPQFTEYTSVALWFLKLIFPGLVYYKDGVNVTFYIMH